MWNATLQVCCATCKHSLCSSSAQFLAPGNWLAFRESLPDVVVIEQDFDLGFETAALCCATCKWRLGVLWHDAHTAGDLTPNPTNDRHCINADVLVLDAADGQERPVPPQVPYQLQVVERQEAWGHQNVTHPTEDSEDVWDLEYTSSLRQADASQPTENSFIEKPRVQAKPVALNRQPCAVAVQREVSSNWGSIALTFVAGLTVGIAGTLWLVRGPSKKV